MRSVNTNSGAFWRGQSELGSTFFAVVNPEVGAPSIHAHAFVAVRTELHVTLGTDLSSVQLFQQTWQPKQEHCVSPNKIENANRSVFQELHSDSSSVWVDRSGSGASTSGRIADSTSNPPEFKSPYANVSQDEWQRAGESLWEQMESGMPSDADIEFELDRLREVREDDFWDFKEAV